MKTAEMIHLSGKNKNKSAVELLAGIPSVIYDLLGIMILNPLMYKVELALFKDSETHQFTIGLVLFVFIMMINIVMEKS